MRIAIGMHIQEGAFGGGNQFGKLLTRFLRQHGHDVFFDLAQPALDLVLMTDPRTSLQSVAFGPIQIMRYVHDINPSVLLVHRINECDERKGTKTLNRFLSTANDIMDHTIFISSWLEQLHVKQHPFTKSRSVILNGADRSIFSYQKHRLPSDRKIRLVTHHWSGNWNKGWDVYTHLDHLLATTKLGERLTFTYIGNVPARASLQAIQVIPPKSGSELARELHQHDLYITASLHEPAGMHHIEAALCGLPLLYRVSGALPEYCHGYGVPFENSSDVERSLETLIADYDQYADRLATYPNDAQIMCGAYTHLFETLLTHKAEILATRSSDRFNTFHRLQKSLSLTLLHLRDRV
ncbi:MAG: hypothetical protein NUV84_00700 [Candidatus Uhrbacteria bacterium]|nr:hypothetical protein [Candidatus Uhrbacteria bacterium]